MKRILVISFLCSLCLNLTAQTTSQEARLLRFPAVGGNQIAFSYAGDLYTVPINGGAAQKITSHIGFEVFPRFSPDGKTLAFTAQYDGNTEVYRMAATGGIPERVTWSASVERDDIGDRIGPNNIVIGWTPDGKDIIYRSRWYAISSLRGQVCMVPQEGGDSKVLPASEASFCSFSPDGKQLAMNRMFREFRTWKYYRGGQADDIWIHQMGTTKLDNITNNPAQDIFPMWIDKEIYFLSDRDSIMNLFCYNTQNKSITKITDFDTYDVKFPSNSKEHIVFENGGFIYKYTVATRKTEKVNITLNSEDIYARNQWVDASSRLSSIDLSPDGSRVLVSGHGDIFSVPATEGGTYNLTLTSGVHERNGAWSPDGSKIAFFSDKSGEYQLYVAPYNDLNAAQQISQLTHGYPQALTWTPDSKGLYFTTDERDLFYADVTAKTANRIIVFPHSGIRGYDISPDSKWLTYVTEDDNRTSVVYLYEVATGKSTPVTTQWYNASSPIFSQDGKYLFYSSACEFSNRMSQVEWNAIYNVSSLVFVVPLAKDTPSPVILKGKEYEPAAPAKEEAPAPADSKKGGKDASAKKPAAPSVPDMKVDLDGIVERAAALPLPASRYQLMAAFDDELYYSSGAEIMKISMKDLKISTVTRGRLMAFALASKKALLNDGGKMFVVGAPSWKGDKQVDMSQVKVYVDYPQEWAQIFNETWRVFRDGFYLPTMHGRDWNFIHDKYAQLLPYVKHRSDLTYVIGEMISELNIGHTYVTSPASKPTAPVVKVGLLGAKFAKDQSGAFKVTHVFKGENWDASLYSPLTVPGVEVKEGDFILSVDGINCADLKSIYQALVGKVGKTVALKVNASAGEKGARIVYVKPIASESQLAYYEWVQNNIAKVDKASNGQIGYIHIPDMSTAGLDMFTKLFYTQLTKKALIIDDRMNGGGNVSPIILERLSREMYRISMYRNSDNIPVPNEMHYGPKVCLIDKYSSSDGDLFPYSFRELGIGKLIGKRTWGGIVGISGSKPYLDGQDVRTPFFTSYSTEGEWIVEGHGVDPDIEVDINPFEDYLGTDAQLNKAVEVLMEEMKDWKPIPPTPADRKM